MASPAPATSRYRVRFGTPTFGERALQSMAAVGFDAYGIAAMGLPGPNVVPAVIEIFDHVDRQVVWRACDDRATIEADFERITRELRVRSLETFAAEWDLR